MLISAVGERLTVCGEGEKKKARGVGNEQHSWTAWGDSCTDT